MAPHFEWVEAGSADVGRAPVARGWIGKASANRMTAPNAPTSKTPLATP
jgi:hypothetical protein